MGAVLLIAKQDGLRAFFAAELSAVYTVLKAASVEEGLSILREKESGIGAILIELSLARGDGFFLASRMEKQSVFNRIPLLALCEAPPSKEDMDCLSHGFFDLLSLKTPPPLIRARVKNAAAARESISIGEMERILRQLPSCIFLKDAEGRYVFSTQIWRHLDTGGDPDWTIRGKTDLEIRRDRGNALRAMEADRKILETGEGTEYIIEENEDGKREYLELIKRPVRDENGRVSGIIALINDVTDRQALKQELEKRAKTDGLSGLLNKKAAEEMIRVMLSGQRREDKLCALLMIDIDRFKQVNDTLGHAEGDRVIAGVGRILRNSCRAFDVAGRIGGDEFAIFARDIGEPENAMRLAGRILTEMKRTFPESEAQPQITLSIGVALYPEHGSGFDDLFRAADGALYAVKRGGRNGCAMWSPEDLPAPSN